MTQIQKAHKLIGGVPDSSLTPTGQILVSDTLEPSGYTWMDPGQALDGKVSTVSLGTSSLGQLLNKSMYIQGASILPIDLTGVTVGQAVVGNTGAELSPSLLVDNGTVEFLPGTYSHSGVDLNTNALNSAFVAGLRSEKTYSLYGALPGEYGDAVLAVPGVNLESHKGYMIASDFFLQETSGSVRTFTSIKNALDQAAASTNTILDGSGCRVTCNSVVGGGSDFISVYTNEVLIGNFVGNEWEGNTAGVHRGRVVVDPGAHYNPSITFEGDAGNDTGLFLEADGRMGVTCNGLKRGEFNENGWSPASIQKQREALGIYSGMTTLPLHTGAVWLGTPPGSPAWILTSWEAGVVANVRVRHNLNLPAYGYTVQLTYYESGGAYHESTPYVEQYLPDYFVINAHETHEFCFMTLTVL